MLGEPGGAGLLTLREVARRAGVSHAAPYRHFPSKEALLAEVAEVGFRRLIEEMLPRAHPMAGDRGASEMCGFPRSRSLPAQQGVRSLS